MITSGCSLSPTSASVFGRRLPLFGVSMRTPSGVPSGQISTHASIYKKMQTVSPVRHVWGSFKFRHRGNISRKQCVTVMDVWGTCGARERCLGWQYRGIRRDTYSRTRKEIEALLDHLDQMEATVQPRLPCSSLTVCYFEPSESHEHPAGLGQDPPQIWG